MQLKDSMSTMAEMAWQKVKCRSRARARVILTPSVRFAGAFHGVLKNTTSFLSPLLSRRGLYIIIDSCNFAGTVEDFKEPILERKNSLSAIHIIAGDSPARSAVALNKTQTEIRKRDENDMPSY